MANKTKLGTLFVDLELQMPDFQQAVSKGRQQALNYGKELEQAMRGGKMHLAPTVDLSGLHELNKVFDSKIAHHKQVQQQLNQVLSPKVDLSGLTGLSAAFSGVAAQHQSAQSGFNSKPLSPKVDDANLTRLDASLSGLLKTYGSINIGIGFSVDSRQLTALQNNLTTLAKTQEYKVTVDASATILGEKSGVGLLAKGIDALIQATKDNKQGFFKNITAGIAQNFGLTIGGALQRTARKNFGFDIRKDATEVIDNIIVPIKNVFVENPAVIAAQEKLAAKLQSKFKVVGYKMGDGLVEAISQEGATLPQRFNSFVNASVMTEEFKTAWRDAIDDVAAYSKESRIAILQAPSIQEGIQGVFQGVAARRDQALEERAIPEVLKRAQAIAESGKETKNIGEQTQELILVTGGYAGAGGRSGVRIQKDLEQAPELVERFDDKTQVLTDEQRKRRNYLEGVFSKSLSGGVALSADEEKERARLAKLAKQERELVKQYGKPFVVMASDNKESDISEAARGDTQPAPWMQAIGLTMGEQWLKGVSRSLATPNIRGYSNDAVDMAAKAVAALEKNPELKIKFLGESGGGFVAEEAAAILKKMGYDNVEYLGVGTPNFAGGLDADGEKLISPDEALGSFAPFASKFGLADASMKSQQALGVTEHPYENYRRVMPAEFQRFLSGPANPMSLEKIADLKTMALEDSQADFDRMLPKELKQAAETALQNMEYIRYQLMDATEETEQELKELADIYKSIYLNAARSSDLEPPSMARAREMVTSNKAIIAELKKKPGIDSGLKAQQLKTELQAGLKEFQQHRAKYDGTLHEYVGTLAAKHDAISAELEEMLAELDDSGLGINRPLVAIPAEPMPDLSNLASLKKDGELVLADRELPGNVATRAALAVGNGIVKAAENTADFIKEKIEDFVVDRVNDKLMRVPGSPDVLDPSRQIGGLDELSPGDVLKMARIDLEDTLRAGVGGTAKALSVAKGAEATLFGAVPPLALIKALTKRLALPAAAFGATAGALPGGEMAAGHLTHLTESLLSLPADAAAEAMSGAFAEAIMTTIGQVPLIGGKLAPALTEAVSALLTGASTGLATGAAEVLTPVVGGSLLLGAGETAAKAVLPDLTPEQLQANKQLQAATEDRLKKLQGAMKTVRALSAANPEKARYIAGVFKEKNPELAAGLDSGMKALPASARMMQDSGGELAQLKGQLAIAARQLEASEKRAGKLAEFLRKAADAVAAPVEILGDVIDVEAVPVGETKALPASKEAQKDLQKSLDVAVAMVAAQIREIGKSFTDQVRAIKGDNLDSNIKAEVAASIEAAKEEARDAITAAVGAFGNNAPKSVRDAAKTARGQITTSTKTTAQIVADAKDVGAAIPAGINAELTARTASLKSSATKMAEVVIKAAEAKLEIKSPSQVFRRIGRFVVQGFEQGMDQLSANPKVAEMLNKTIAIAKDAAQQAEQVAKATIGKISKDPVGVKREARRTAEGLGALGSLASDAIGLVGKAPSGSAKIIAFLEDLKDRAAEALAEMVKPLPGGDMFSDLITKLNKVTNLFKPLIVAFGGLAVFNSLMPVLEPVFNFLGDMYNRVGQLIAAFENAAIEVESLQAKFKANFGSAGIANFEAATQSAVDLRQNLAAGRDAYIQFATAVKGTPLERTTEAGLEALNKAALVQGLSGEQSERARTAIIQSAGKGQLYSEEVFGQLAEALPNAPAVLARSIGTDIAGLRSRMKNGLAAEEVLPAFFAQLSAESEIGVSDALDTTAASMTNLSNQTLLLQETIGKGMLPAKKLGLDVLAATAQAASVALPPLVELISALSLAIGGKLMASLVSMSSMNGAGLVAGAKAAFGLLQGAWSATVAFFNQPANSLAGWTLGIMGAFQTFKLISGMFSDAGGAAREFADNSKKALAEYRAAVERDGKTPLFKDTGKSALETTLIGGIIGAENARALERGGNKLMEMAGTGFVKNPETGKYERGKMEFNIPEFVPFIGGNTFTPGFTVGQKQAQDQEIARNDAIAQADIIQGEMINLQQSGVTDRIKKLNEQIAVIQARRRSIPRGQANDQQIADLSQQERLLTDQREELQKPGRFFSGRNAAAIELFRKLRDEATDPAEYERLDAALKNAIAQQNQFNESFSRVVRSAGSLRDELTKITGVLDENNQKISIFASNARADVADQRISGATEGQAGYQEFLNQQQEAVKRIEATNQAIASSAALLNDVETQRILAANNFTNESSAAEIRDKANRMEESPDRERLEVAADQIDRITGLQETNAGLNAGLKEAQAQFVQKMRDLARSVADFYRGIEQQAIEASIDTRRLGVEVGVSTAQNRLRSAMVGFQRSFTNDFVESLIGMVETLAKPAQAALDAQQQITQAQQAYFQQIQQATQLQQQLPQQTDLNYGGGQLGALPGVPMGQLPGAPVQGQQPGVPTGQPGQPLANVPNTIGQLTPDQIAAGLNGMNSLSAPQAVQFSGQGIQQGLDLADAAYQQQVQNIQRRAAMAQQQAQMELAMSMSQADFQAQQAVRTMNEQGRGIGRSTQDLQLQGQAQTPEVELQGQLNGLYRQYEDQLIAISDFEMGLSQTLDQQLLVRDQILSGALPEEFKSLLPAINETIATAEQQLSDLAANSAAYNEAYTAAVAEQRRLAEQARNDRAVDAQVRVQDASNQELSDRAALARAQGQGDVAADLDMRGQIESALKNYQDQMIALEREARLNPELAARSDELQASFARLRDTAIATAEAEWNRMQAENRFAAESRRLSGQVELTQGTAGLLRTQASMDRSTGFNTNGMRANELDLEARLQGQQNSFRERIKEYEDMRRAGSLTADELVNLKAQAEQFNNVSLANIRAEFAKTQQTNRENAKQKIGGLRSELMGARIEGLRADGRDGEADRLNQKLQVANQKASFNQQIQELQDLRNAGALTNQEFNQMYGLINQINRSSLSNLRDQMPGAASVQTVSDRLTDLGNNGDLSTAFSTAFANQALKFNDAMNFNKSLNAPRISSGEINAAISGGNASEVVARLDSLISVAKQQASSLSRPNLTVNSTDALGSAAGIYNDISRDTMRGSGL